MICTRCGNNCPDGIAYCNHCGNPMQSAQQPVYQQPVYQQPMYQQPVYQQPVQKPPYVPPVYQPLKFDASKPLKQYSHIICLVISVIALVVGLLTATTLLWGTDFDQTADLFGGAFLYIANILYGILSLVMFAMGLLYVLKKFSNQPFYDQFVGKLIRLEDPTFVICAIGVLAGLMQWAIFFVASGIAMEFEVTLDTHWVNGLATAVYAVIGAANLVAQGKKD